MTKSNKGLVLTGLFSFLLICLSSFISSSRDSRPFDPYFEPPKGIEHFTFGFRESLADSLWIRVIQDFDYCEKKLQTHMCQNNGWVYHIIDTIIDLSPHFRDPAVFGALMLSVVVKDEEGASKIFDRGVELFPTDWPLLYTAGYQALFQEKNKAKAARLMEAAAKNGAPSWVYALATKMYTESVEKELGESLYETLKASGMSEEILAPVGERLKQ